MSCLFLSCTKKFQENLSYGIGSVEDYSVAYFIEYKPFLLAVADLLLAFYSVGLIRESDVQEV